MPGGGPTICPPCACNNNHIMDGTNATSSSYLQMMLCFSQRFIQDQDSTSNGITKVKLKVLFQGAGVKIE